MCMHNTTLVTSGFIIEFNVERLNKQRCYYHDWLCHMWTEMCMGRCYWRHMLVFSEFAVHKAGNINHICSTSVCRIYVLRM